MVEGRFGVSVCGWCDKLIVGEPDKRLHLKSGTEVFNGLVSSEAEFVETDFCCMGCAWSYGMREHVVIFFMSPPEAFSHLMSSHGLSFSVGLAEGARSYELFMRKLDVLGRMLRELSVKRSWS